MAAISVVPSFERWSLKLASSIIDFELEAEASCPWTPAGSPRPIDDELCRASRPSSRHIQTTTYFRLDDSLYERGQVSLASFLGQARRQYGGEDFILEARSQTTADGRNLLDVLVSEYHERANAALAAIPLYSGEPGTLPGLGELTSLTATLLPSTIMDTVVRQHLDQLSGGIAVASNSDFEPSPALSEFLRNRLEASMTRCTHLWQLYVEGKSPEDAARTVWLHMCDRLHEDVRRYTGSGYVQVCLPLTSVKPGDSLQTMDDLRARADGAEAMEGTEEAEVAPGPRRSLRLMLVAADSTDNAL